MEPVGYRHGYFSSARGDLLAGEEQSAGDIQRRPRVKMARRDNVRDLWAWWFLNGKPLKGDD